MKYKSLVTTVFILANANVYGESKTSEPSSKYEFQKKQVLKIDSVSSNIEITASDSDKTIIKTKVNKFNKEKCEFKVDSSDDTVYLMLDLKGKDKSFNFSVGDEKNKDDGDVKECDVDFVISVPQKNDLKISYIRGELNIQDIEGDVTINKVEGNSKVTGNFGKLESNFVEGDFAVIGKVKDMRVNLVSGKLKLKGTVEELSANIADGSADIEFTEVMKKGKINVKAVSGDTKVIIPKNMKITTSHFSFQGELKNYAGDSKDAEYKISVKTVSGGLTIEKE